MRERERGGREREGRERGGRERERVAKEEGCSRKVRDRD